MNFRGGGPHCDRCWLLAGSQARGVWGHAPLRKFFEIFEICILKRFIFITFGVKNTKYYRQSLKKYKNSHSLNGFAISSL